MNIVPGNAWEQSSFRVELGGIASSLVVVKAICEWAHIASGSVTVGLNGKEAMKAVKGSWILSPEDADRDLIFNLRKKTIDFLTRIEWQWVKGHQDSSIPFAQLGSLAKDNVVADSMAKSLCHLLDSRKFRPCPVEFDYEKWSISVQGKKWARFDTEILFEVTSAPEVSEYWNDRRDENDEWFDLVDWEALKIASKNMPFSKIRRNSKASSN